MAELALDVSHWSSDVEPDTRCEVCDEPFFASDLPLGELCCDECYWRDRDTEQPPGS